MKEQENHDSRRFGSDDPQIVRLLRTRVESDDW